MKPSVDKQIWISSRDPVRKNLKNLQILSKLYEYFYYCRLSHVISMDIQLMFHPPPIWFIESIYENIY